MSPGDDSPFGVYLDDCLSSHRLIRALQAAGFRVTTPLDASLRGARDRDHFLYASSARLALLTSNPRDFVALAEESALVTGSAPHAGILAVYQDNDSNRDMSPTEIVRAIENPYAAGVPIAGQVHIVNRWRY